jgi:hypothetical protein
MEEYLLTPREVDRLLRYPQGRAVRLAKARRIPSVSLPDGEIRFRESEILALIQSESGGKAVGRV